MLIFSIYQYIMVAEINESKIKIKEITDCNLENSVEIIRRSFRTVADELGLNIENCPTHPSFITLYQLAQLRDKGFIFFGTFLENEQVGFIAVEKADDALFYIEKLAVLPEYRHKGYGKKLVEAALAYIMGNGGKRVSIGIIFEQPVLKEWYQGMCFREVSVKQFEHLPFRVCFMEIAL
jgi:GNAT superfamily N-acetyltransferase